MKLSLTLDAILDFLHKKNFKAEIQPELKQIATVLRALNQDFPLFMKPDETGSLLQLIVFLPYALQPEGKLEVARILHYLNKEIDYPGFGMDEEAGAIFYRIVMLGFESKVHSELVDKALDSMPRLCETFFPMITLAMTGKMKADVVIEKAKQARLKLMEGKK